MNSNTRFLRRVIALDAIVTGMMALGFVLAARPLSELFGMPVIWLTGIGLVLLPFVAWVGWLAKQSAPPRKLVWLLIAANIVWSVDSFLLLLSGWLPITTIGIEFIVAQALMTIGAVVLEFIAVRVTYGTQLTA